MSTIFGYLPRKKSLFISLLTVLGLLSLFAWNLVISWKQQTSNDPDSALRYAKKLSKNAPLKRRGSRLNVDGHFRRTTFSPFESTKFKEKIRESLPRKVLIVSRGRSGSTFLGNFFNENRDFLYFFEPLLLLEGRENNTRALQVLDQIYSCRTVNESLAKILLKGKSFYLKSNRIKLFLKKCSRRVNKNACLAQLIKSSCKQSKAVVVKVLTHRLPRAGLWGIRKLLETNTNLKIIHLIRDPRRVIASMKKANWYEGKNISEYGEIVCGSVWTNIEYVRKNKDFFYGRYKLVVFSDMIKNRYETVVGLYHFLKMGSVPENVFSWIRRNTEGSSRLKRTDLYSTYRNSTEVLTRNVNFSKKDNTFIKKHCQNVIDLLEHIKENPLPF